jgi:hypothetical protein
MNQWLFESLLNLVKNGYVNKLFFTFMKYWEQMEDVNEKVC